MGRAAFARIARGETYGKGAEPLETLTHTTIPSNSPSPCKPTVFDSILEMTLVAPRGTLCARKGGSERTGLPVEMILNCSVQAPAERHPAQPTPE